MSRNKDIELLHIISKEPYSVCRRKMKEAHWNLTDALLGKDFFNIVNEMYRTVTEICKNLAEGLAPAIKHMKESVQSIMDAYIESKHCPHCNTGLIRPWFEYDYCPYCGAWFNKDSDREEDINEDLGNHPI